MPAHVVYEKIDSEPAGFSKVWLQDVLKNQLSFDGHVVSDDLSMQGAAIKGGYKERSLAALEAGCDILLACNSSQASVEILSAMESIDIEPMLLTEFKPRVCLIEKNAEIYQAAKQELLDLGLIK